MARLQPDHRFTHGLQQRFFTAAGALIEDAWDRAIYGRQIVGGCRWCPGSMVADPYSDDGTTKYLHARCIDCGREVGLSLRWGGSVLRRSSARGEMPSGFWDSRLQHLDRQKATTLPYGGDR